MAGKNNLWREICEWHVEILIFGPMIIAPIVIVLGLLFGVIPLVPEPHIVQGEVCGKMYIAPENNERPLPLIIGGIPIITHIGKDEEEKFVLQLCVRENDEVTIVEYPVSELEWNKIEIGSYYIGGG